MSDTPETFESLRPLLFAIAYRMLASVSDAEDVLQESYLRYRRALDEGTTIGSLKAYLSTIVTRLAMDHLRSAAQRREEYVGLWLPEPLPVQVGGQTFPVVWSIVGSALFVAVIGLISRARA